MKVIIHNARQAYMTYYEPKGINNGKPCFSGTYIIDEKTKISVPELGLKQVDPSKLDEICKKVVHAKFGKNTAKDKNWFFNKADGSTTRDQYVNDDGDYHDGFEADTWFISAKKYPDQISASKCGQFAEGELYVVDQTKDRITPQQGKLKPGDRVNVITDVYAFDTDGTKGSTGSLEGVQLKKKDEALKLGGGRIDAGSDFDEEEMDDEDDIM